MSEVDLVELKKCYRDGTLAVASFNVTLGDGEFLVLVGPSGCGKTTTLRMVAGLEEVSAGRIRVGDVDVTNLPPKDRDIAMVFQNYALYPHMSVFDNIAFGLRRRHVPKTEIQARVQKAIDVLGLGDLASKKPTRLSGGQQQRVAMGRAIVREPKVFLMDEPLSNLDAKLRVEMRAEISHLQRRLEATTMYVTHDQGEAMTLGDRVAVMKDGYVQQIATPEIIYDQPANMFVASFIGAPPMNLLRAHLGVVGDTVQVQFAGQGCTLPPGVLADRPSLGGYVGRDVVVGIRPEDLKRVDAHATSDGVVKGSVDVRENLGSEVVLHMDFGGAATSFGRDLLIEEGEKLPPLAAPFIARVDRQADALPGSVIWLGFNAGKLHWFDPQTGDAIS